MTHRRRNERISRWLNHCNTLVLCARSSTISHRSTYTRSDEHISFVEHTNSLTHSLIHSISVRISRHTFVWCVRFDAVQWTMNVLLTMEPWAVAQLFTFTQFTQPNHNNKLVAYTFVCVHVVAVHTDDSTARTEFETEQFFGFWPCGCVCVCVLQSVTAQHILCALCCACI